MDSLANTAAYHGAGWRRREGTLAGDVAGGDRWRPVGAPSEWATLRTVLLALPDPGWPTPEDWNAVQYLGPVRFDALRGQLLKYAGLLTDLGVEVISVDLAAHGGHPRYNAIFTRDQFLATDEGALVARMGSEPRAGEERVATVALATAGLPILATIRGAGTFEAADALRVSPELVLLGVGNRTNATGAEQVRRILADQGARTVPVRLPVAVQHLLGLVQLVDHDLAVVRTELAPPELLRFLDGQGIRWIGLSEGPGVNPGQAMNFVVLSARRVVMIAGWPDIEQRLAAGGVDVVATVACPDLLNAAGGIACATGILWRHDEPRPAAPVTAYQAGGST